MAVPFEAPGKLAGYRRHRAHPATIAVVVDAAEAGLDTEGGRLAVQCLLHSEIVNTDHIDVANDLIKDPTEFCEYCREAAQPARGGWQSRGRSPAPRIVSRSFAGQRNARV